MTDPHPADVTLQSVIDERADPKTEDVVTSHLSECVSCQERLAELIQAPDSICVALRRESTSGDLVQPPVEAPTPSDESWVADFAVAFLEPSASADAIGRLGELDVLSVIGHGGMGIVLKGFQPELNRPVAIKVMSPHLATIGTARKRFLREAQATAAIVHPNVMPVLSVCESSSLPYLVMPYVACRTLQQRIDADGPLPIAELLRVAIQVAAALAAAHRQGLVHRDVKPANILIERGVDRTMLTDFGLARAADDVTVTRSGVIAGTPQYMSPEQARGEPIDARSDLFSLGSVIHAMAVGAPPFRAETSYGILRKITDHPHRPMRETLASVPEWLDRLVDRLLCKDAGDRIESADEAQALLEACLAHVQQPGVGLPPELNARLAWRRWAIASALVLFAVLITTGVWFGSQPSEQARPQPPAVLEATVDPFDAIDAELEKVQRQIETLTQEMEGNL